MDNFIKDNLNKKTLQMSDRNDSFIEYCVKKSEKISGAIYILTNFISSKEPIRHSLRKKSLKLVSDTFGIKDIINSGSGTTSNVLNLTTSTIPEIITLLNISVASSFVSEMNASILINELSNLSNLLKDRFSLNKALLLSKNDLYVPEKADTLQQKMLNKENEITINQDKIKNRDNLSKGHFKKYNKVITKKTNRRNTIISLIKEIGSVTVRDASLKLPEYSEKTVQRELVKMVKEHILKKEGERRWTKYSLA